MTIRDRIDQWRKRRAARTLGQLGRDAKARRAAMLAELRREVRECKIQPLGWRA